MTDREKTELAEVFAMVLDSRLLTFGEELAGMVVAIIECTMTDLAKILTERKGEVAAEMLRKMEERRSKVGFTR